MSKSPSLIDKALAFCAGKFGGAQPVGDAGIYCVPDRTELIRILQEEGGESDPFLTVAAVLRQTIQLTSTSDEEIAQVFGPEVGMVVAELTENVKFSLATRKALRILVMPSLSRKAKLVVLAEIIETVRQIGSKTAPKSWSLQQKQRGILEQAWIMLKPGGLLLYITCSVFPEEGEDQAIWFAAGHSNAVRLGAPGQILPTEVSDGFYYALFKKNGP
jgi:(p)ppGpp synthase/HD superfamily hydrolase